MKYTIELAGRGAESFIFKLDEEQYEALTAGAVDEDEMSSDEICEVLGVDFYDESSEIITGIFVGKNHGEHLFITVKDEDENVVWESTEDFDFNKVEEKELYDDGEYLCCEDYQKGLFFIYQLEADNFDPNLLEGVITKVLGQGTNDYITDIKYNGQDFSEREWGDTSSKGFTYYLS